MTQTKQSREQIALDFLRNSGPCFITYETGDEGPTRILLSGNEKGEVFWLNESTGPENPLITLEEVLKEAKHLLLLMFTGDMETDIPSTSLYSFEDELRAALKKSELTDDETRDIKIKFMDVKEDLLKEVAAK